MTSYHYLLASAGAAGGFSHFFVLLMAFVLACFIGYFVVWSVTPALHSPLMGVTNAISSVIIVGAILALVGGDDSDNDNFSINKLFGAAAVVLAAVNIVGGFLVTQRMLAMFQKKKMEKPQKGKKK